MSYELALFAHILVVVLLLGVDPGRLYLARVGAATATAPAARLAAARAVLWLGTLGNAALVLLLPAGVTVGAQLGAFRIASPTWLAATAAVTLGWLLLSVAADRAATGHGRARHLTTADSTFRLLMGLGQVYDGSIALAGTNISVEARWLGLKILIFGLLILLSIATRRAGFALRREIAVLAAAPAATAAHTAADARLARALGGLPAPVLGGSLLLLVAAWCGVAKPL
jgi:hypothetical protein